MPKVIDGPSTDLAQPLPLKGRWDLSRLKGSGLPAAMVERGKDASSGACVLMGLPFKIGKVLVLREEALTISLKGVRAAWLAFLHTTDVSPSQAGPTRGEGGLNLPVADYVLVYADGHEERVNLRRRHQVGAYSRRWGENCFQCVSQGKPRPLGLDPEEGKPFGWGWAQSRISMPDNLPWTNWIYCWENPRPGEALKALRIEPVAGGGALVLSALTALQTASLPTVWGTRQKALLKAPKAGWDPKSLALDLGQIISIEPKLSYDHATWTKGGNPGLPDVARQEYLVEYSCHPEAKFYGLGKKPVAAASLGKTAGSLRRVPAALQTVELKVVEKGGSKPVPVRLHVHGTAGEYLPPLDRQRQTNPRWFEDYTPEHLAGGRHACAYIDGQCSLRLPLGKVYIEISKGFEAKPLRKVLNITPRTQSLTLELERVLDWRRRGWVSADTHVHFLSPSTAHLEGSAEGVNVVNLLAAQWGELMTNTGDFDGKTTFGSKEAGGSGEHLVRVGSENRQHVLGHISLLGYKDHLITPLSSGGPDEAAMGDPLEVLLSEWARQCRRQGGLVVLPHFPQPRAEHAAVLVQGLADGVEMTSWGFADMGLDPYALADWYRYLNCGYQVPAVAGTDKMSADTAIGTVRVYAKLGKGELLSYEAWKQALRRGGTFVSYGPLLDVSVEGKSPGSKIALKASGGTLQVRWFCQSLIRAMSRLEIVVNGEVRHSVELKPWENEGSFELKVKESCWIAVLLRGRPIYDKRGPDLVAAHTSAVMVHVEGKPLFSRLDAVTILEQIEGVLAYLDSVGSRAQTQRYKAMRLEMQSAHRRLHQRMHVLGQDHPHSVTQNHPEHWHKRRGH